jgi:exodeoxyribonuclease VII small subunit
VTTPDATPIEQLTYREAMQEVQEIVNRLQNTETEGGIDVDELVTDVTRAKELLNYCGGKVKKADTEVRNVINDLKSVDKAEPEVASVSEPEPFDSDSTDGVPF